MAVDTLKLTPGEEPQPPAEASTSTTAASSGDLEALGQRATSTDSQATQLQLDLSDELVGGENGFSMPDAVSRPRCQIRCLIVGLVALGALRFVAASACSPPLGTAWTAHMLSCGSDAVALLGSIPVMDSSVIGPCVRHRFLGMVHMIMLVATAADIAAIVLFCKTPGTMDRLMGTGIRPQNSLGVPIGGQVGIWDCILFASVFLELALLLSAWQFYRALREQRIYPPDAELQGISNQVSSLECLLEPEDVPLLGDRLRCLDGQDDPCLASIGDVGAVSSLSNDLCSEEANAPIKPATMVAVSPVDVSRGETLGETAGDSIHTVKA